MSKETFKVFVRENPKLINFVNQGEITWQKFYEMYDMYGENHQVWNKYLENSTVEEKKEKNSSFLGDTSIKELFNMVKNVDLETVRKGVDGLQKAISLVQDFGGGSSAKTAASQYQARPMYKYFED